MRTCLLIIVLLSMNSVLASSVFSDQTSKNKFLDKNVFDRDDRFSMTDVLSFPYSAILKLYNNTTACTAELVSEDIAMTNAHCVTDNEGRLHKKINLYAGVVDSTYYDIASAVDVVYGDRFEKASGDWAFIRLSNPLGSIYNFLKFNEDELSNNFFQYNHNVMLAGFSGNWLDGLTAGVHRKCKLRKDYVTLDLYYHDCDAGSGSSGGAILSNDDFTIVGLNFAELRDNGPDGTSLVGIPYSDKFANLAINGRFIYEKFLKAQKVLKKRGTTTIKVCNRSNQSKLYLSLAYKESRKWNSIGWYTVEKNECAPFQIPLKKDSKIYYYAKSGNLTWSGKGQEGSKKFCQHITNRFERKGLKSKLCFGKDFEKKSYRVEEVKYNKFNYINLKN